MLPSTLSTHILFYSLIFFMYTNIFPIKDSKHNYIPSYNIAYLHYLLINTVPYIQNYTPLLLLYSYLSSVPLFISQAFCSLSFNLPSTKTIINKYQATWYFTLYTFCYLFHYHSPWTISPYPLPKKTGRGLMLMPGTHLDTHLLD